MKILTPNGYKDIKKAQMGDKVVYFDLNTGEKLENEILAIEEFTKKEWDKRNWDEDVYGQEEDGTPFFIGTTEHRDPFDWYLINGTEKFFKNQSIWYGTADDSIINVKHAKDLVVGDIIYDDDNNNMVVEKVEKVDGTDSDVFYWFHISGDHSYIVDNITLHNATRYWVSSTNANWDGTASSKWDASSASGAGGASIPTSSDDVYFSNSISSNCTISSGNTGAKTIDCTYGTGYAGTIAGTTGISLYGSVTLNSGMTYTYTGVMTFANTSGTAVITTAGKTFGSVTRSGAGGTTQLGDAFNYSATCTIALTGGTFDTNNNNISPAATGNYLSISRSGTNALTLTLGSSTIDGTGSTSSNGGSLSITGTSGMTLTSNTATFNNFQVFSCAQILTNWYTVNLIKKVGAQSNLGGGTYGTLSMTGRADAFGWNITDNITVSTALTITGLNSTTQRVLIGSNTVGTQRTITCNGTLSLTNVDFQDIVGAGSASWTGTSLGNCLNNSGITFDTPKTMYWVGGGGNASDSAEWSSSDGGSGGYGTPLPQDTLIFTANSGTGTATMNMTRLCTTFNGTNRPSTLAITISTATSIFGDFDLGANGNFTQSAALNFYGRGTHNIYFRGKTVGNTINMFGYGGTYTFADGLSASTRTIASQVSGGGTAIVFSNNDHVIGVINSNVSSGVSYTFSSGTIELDSATNALNLAAADTVTHNNGTIKFTNNSATTKTCSLRNKTFYNIWVATSGAYIQFNTAGFTCNNLRFSASTQAQFTGGQTYTFNSLTCDGGSGTEPILNVASGTTKYIWSCANPVSVDYINIDYCDADGNVPFYAGTHSTDGGHNTDWSFTVPPPTEVAITKSNKYTIKKAVSPKTASLKYAVRPPPTPITKSLTYNISASTEVSITKSSKYTIKRTISPITKSLKYTVKKAVSATKSLKYTAKKAFSSTKSLKYGIVKSHNNTFSLAYKTRKSTDNTKQLSYKTKKGVSITKGLQYIIRDLTSLTKSLKYTIKKSPKDVFTKSLSYSVKKIYSLTKSLNYFVKKKNSNTKSLAYKIKTDTVISKSLTYRLLSEVSNNIQKSLSYNVKNGIKNELSLQYLINKQGTDTKQLSYSLNTTTKSTKTLLYKLTTEIPTGSGRLKCYIPGIGWIS